MCPKKICVRKFIIVPDGKNPNVYQKENVQPNAGIFIQWDTTEQEERMGDRYMYNTEEP